MYEKRGERKEFSGFFGRHKSLVAASTLVGTIVGAGILGIPYVISKAGLWYGFLIILFLGLAFLLLNLFGGEVVLRTKKQFQLTGYAGKYLGPTGKRLMTLAMLISIYGALIAYLIGEGSTLHALFGVGTPMMYSVIFFVVTFFIINRGVKATGRAELILIGLLLAVVAVIGVLSFDKIKGANLTPFNPAYFFLPYGVVLFAYMGMPAIPEMQEQLGKHKKKMRKAIIAGSITPIILYLIFTFIIVGVISPEQFATLSPNERIATIALSMYSYPTLGLFANLLAVLAMFTSFLTLGIALKEVYEYDYKLSKNLALGLTFLVPLIVVLLNLTSFITVLGLTGALAGGLESILIILMYWKAKKLGDRKPEYSLPKLTAVGVVLIAMFIVGILYQFITI